MSPKKLALVLLTVAVVEACAVFVYYLRFPPGDFDTYRNAALDVRDGGRLYGNALIWRDAGYALAAPGPLPTETTAYIYPPFLAVTLVPLTFLPHGLGHALWCAAIVGSVAAGAVVIGRLLSDGRPFRTVTLSSAVAIVLFASQPVRASLTSKQVDGALLLLLVLSLLSFSKRRDVLAGLWFGLAIAIKPFVVLLVLFYLWKCSWRATIVAAVVSATLTLAPFLLLPAGTLQDYLEGTQHFASPVFAASPMGQAIYSVLVRTLTVNQFAVPILDAPWLVTPLRVILGGLMLVFALSQITRERTVSVTTLTLEHGLILATGLLVIPLAEDFHFTYLAAAFAAGSIVGLQAWADRRRPSLLLAAYVSYLGLLCLPALRLVSHAFYRYGDGPVGFPVAALMNFQALLLLIAAVLIAAALRTDLRRQRSPTATG